MAPILPPGPVYTFSKNMGAINCLHLCLKNQKELLYVGTNEGFIHIWDLQINREVKSVKIGDSACMAIVHCNGKYITQARGDCLKYWEVENEEWQLLDTISINHHGFCKILLYNEDIYCPSENGIVTIFQGSSKCQLKNDKTVNRGEVMCMKYVEKGKTLIVAYECGLVSLWSLNNKIPRIEFEFKCDETPLCLDVCELTMEGVVGTSGETVKKFVVEENILRDACVNTLTNPGVGCIAISKDGKLLVAGCWDGRIRYFSMKSLKLLAVLEHHGDCAIQSVLFSENSISCYPVGTLFAAGVDGRITLWDLYTSRNNML